MLGLLFLLIVLKRDIVHNRALVRNDLGALVPIGKNVCSRRPRLRCIDSRLCVQECGIPKHFGLFYAMGTALMMEGLLSACYHVCPNYTNFQFGESARESLPPCPRGFVDIGRNEPVVWYLRASRLILTLFFGQFSASRSKVSPRFPFINVRARLLFQIPPSCT